MTNPLEVTVNLVYKERLVQILDYKVKQLWNKSIRLIKALWANHASSEEGMRSKYPYLLNTVKVSFKFASFVDETFSKANYLELS